MYRYSLRERCGCSFYRFSSSCSWSSLRRTCEIGDDVSIDTGCVLENVAVGPGTIIRRIQCSLTVGSTNNTIGPFCFVRDNVSAGDSCI